MGCPVELRKTRIAGAVLASHATLVKRDAGHFADLHTLVIAPSCYGPAAA